LISAVLLSLLLVTSASGQDAFAEAQSLRRAGQPVQAVALLETARQAAPDDLDLSGLLGLCLLDANERPRSDALAAELTVDSQIPQPDSSPDARRTTRELAAWLAPRVGENYRCLVFLGRWLATQKRHDEAEVVLSAARELKPRPVEALVELGRCLRKQARLSRGQEIAAELTLVVPELGRRLSADLYLDQGDKIARRAAQNAEAMPRALEAYRSAHELAPDDMRIAERLLNSLINNLRVTEARELLGLVSPEQEQPFEFHRQSGRIAVIANDPALAELHYRKALEHQPGHPEATIPLCRLMLDKGEVDTAVERLELLLITWPEKAEAHLVLGLAEEGRARFVEAEAHLRRSVELNPNEMQALYHLGRVLIRLGRREEARTYLSRYSAESH
jgi:tetratricopeptide (TPR) repeat protein